MSATKSRKSSGSKPGPKKIGGYFVGDDRDLRLFIRVNAAEKKKFLKLAKDRHTDLSELVRQILHREADNQSLKVAS